MGVRNLRKTPGTKVIWFFKKCHITNTFDGIEGDIEWGEKMKLPSRTLESRNSLGVPGWLSPRNVRLFISGSWVRAPR